MNGVRSVPAIFENRGFMIPSITSSLETHWRPDRNSWDGAKFQTNVWFKPEPPGSKWLKTLQEYEQTHPADIKSPTAETPGCPGRVVFKQPARANSFAQELFLAPVIW